MSCVYKVADFICTVVKDAGFLARLAFISHRRAMSHVLDISPESNAVVAGGGSCIHTSTPPNLTLTIDDLAKVFNYVVTMSMPTRVGSHQSLMNLSIEAKDATRVLEAVNRSQNID